MNPEHVLARLPMIFIVFNSHISLFLIVSGSHWNKLLSFLSFGTLNQKNNFLLHPFDRYDDDTILLKQIAGGNEAAFNQLFENHRDKLYHYMLKITKSPEVSEEIVMDVFVKLWVGRELLPNIHQLDGFLHKVAYHKAIDFLRTASRHSRLQKVYIDRAERRFERPADEILIDAEARKLLQKAIQQLPPKRKLIYKLSREEGLTHSQIADALNLSPNTVKNSIVSATKSINDFLTKSNMGKAAFSILFFLC